MNDLPRETLRRLVVQYGHSLCEDPRRCEALLRDHCGEYRREITVLVGALKEGVAADLLASQEAVPLQLLLARLAQRLHDNLGLAKDIARWAVETWAIALGVTPRQQLETERQKSPDASVSPPQPPTPASPTRRQPLNWMTAVAVSLAALVVIVLLGLLFTRGHGSNDNLVAQPSQQRTAALATLGPGMSPSADAAAAPGTVKPGASPTQAAMAPAAQQQIVVQSGEPQYFDPHRSNFEHDIAIEQMLFRGLYQLVVGSDGSVQAVPAMAAGDPTVNGNVYTVKLRTGLKWSDNVPLTANDFVYGIQRECDPKVASPYQYVLGESILNIVGCDDFFNGTGTANGVGVKAIDDTTLQITLGAPKATFTTIMSLWAAFPARQDVISEFGDRWTDPGNIVVNGPFTLSESVPGAGGHAVLRPNPNWALTPKPALQKITINYIDDLEAAFRAFQTGELTITQIPAAEVPTVQGNPTLNSQFLKVGTARIWSVEMQMKNPTIAKAKVRLALSRAIDRAKLVKVVYSDAYLPATYWDVQGLPGFQGNAPFESIIGYDPAAAKQALADAGYPNGQGFPTLTLTVLDRSDRKAEAEFLQKAWGDVLDINVQIQVVDAKTRSQIFNSQNFELFMGGWQNDYPDLENSLIGLFDTGGGNNQYKCSDPDIDAALKAASTETDNAKRIQDLQQAETLIVTRLCGAAPVYQTALLYLVNSKVGGVNPNGQIDAAMPGNWCPECWYVRAQ